VPANQMVTDSSGHRRLRQDDVVTLAVHLRG
jgi:hypothetical protein